MAFSWLFGVYMAAPTECLHRAPMIASTGEHFTSPPHAPNVRSASKGRPCDRRYSFRNNVGTTPDPNVTIWVLPYRFIQAIQRALKVDRFANHGVVLLRDQFDFVFTHHSRPLPNRPVDINDGEHRKRMTGEGQLPKQISALKWPKRIDLSHASQMKAHRSARQHASSRQNPRVPPLSPLRAG
jgi:hypothetical protein